MAMHDDLVSIHSLVLRQLLDTSSKKDDSDVPIYRKPRIDLVCQERCFLRMELEQHRLFGSLSSFPTVAHELEIAATAKRNCQSTFYSKSTEKHRHIGKASELPVVDFSIPSSDEKRSASWMQSLYRLRKRRKIAAAHRLAGVSVIHCSDPNLLGIRFDVCVDSGQFVACHFIFWDVIVKDEDPSCEPSNEEAEVHNFSDQDSNSSLPAARPVAYMRVLQHSIPSQVPLQAILQQVLGVEQLLRLGPTQESIDDDVDDNNTNDDWEAKLRDCCQAIYEACYFLAMREHTWKYLTSLSEKRLMDELDDERGQIRISDVLYVDRISRSDSYDMIGFQLHFLTPQSNEDDDVFLPPMAVELLFSFKQARPDSVSVQRVTSVKLVKETAATAVAHRAGAVSDDEEDAVSSRRPQLFESKLKEAFQQYPIDQAFGIVARLLVTS